MANTSGKSFLDKMRATREARADEAVGRALQRAEERADERIDGSGELGDPVHPQGGHEERHGQRITSQWHELRSRRLDDELPAIETGKSNFSPAHVPWAFDLAAAWSWRLLVVAAAILGSLWLLSFFAVVVLPLLIAMFASALLTPIVHRLCRIGISRRLAALIVVVLGVASLALLLTFVGQQVANGINDLSKQVVDGFQQVRDWLRTGPLGLSDKQFQAGLQKVQDQIGGGGSTSLLSRAGEVGTTVTHIVAGFFIILFGTFFFLADGPLIWTWFVRLFPRAARQRTDSSGRVAWRSLTQFVRATVLVAGTDALGIMIGAFFLGVPLVLAIGVLVFLGAFVPMIGATVSGAAAVLVALVAVGPFKAVLMLAVIIFVQQLEAHVLQPFLMGRFVSVHPLGVIVAIALGVIVGGIPGALIAVPFAAVLNAVVQHLASETDIGDSAAEAAAHDPAPPPPPEPA
ncbi:MAG: AI-2E family transporter [Actinomycetota bacterium]|nr:AI-2E family transporter [Actinomycetota bacterium]